MGLQLSSASKMATVKTETNISTWSQLHAATETETNISTWSQLPADLLHLISQKLTEPSDYIRLRSVCKPWLSIAKLADFPKQVRLLLPYNLSSRTRSFFDLTTNRIHSMDVPEAARGKAICGSSHGWLFLHDEAQSLITLLNPITGACIVLPPTTSLPFGRNRMAIRDPICISNMWDITLTSYPTDADCTVVVSHADSNKIALCNLPSPDWTILDTNLPRPVRAFLCHDSRIYAIDQKGVGVIVYLTNGSSHAIRPILASTTIDPSLSFFPRFYMLVDSAGQILLVADYWRSSGNSRQQQQQAEVEECVEIFRLRRNKVDGGFEWCKIRSLGDNNMALFLSENKSAVVAARAAAADVSGIREDFIYFDSPHLPHWEFRHHKVHHLSCYDVKENSFRLLSCQWERPQETGVRVTTWFTPSLR